MTTFTPEQAAKITESLSVISNLSRQERIFLIHYLAGETKTRAAEIAGYSAPEKQGSRVSKHPRVKAAIDEYFRDQEIGVRELIARMSQQARNEASQYILPNGTVDLPAMIRDGKQHLIKGIRYDSRGNLIVEFIPQFESQVQIGRYLKLWTDNVDHTTAGKEIQQVVQVYLPENGRNP